MKEDMAIFLQLAQTAHPLLVRFIIRHVLSQEQASVLAELARVELARMEAEMARLRAEDAWMTIEEIEGALAGGETGRGGNNRVEEERRL